MLAALDLFSQKGYNSTSVDEIAEAANMKGPNLYKYFKNKDEIFLSLHVLMEENYRSNMSLDPEKYKDIRTSQDLKEFSLRQIRYTITNDNVRKLRKMCTIEQFRNDNLSAEASKHQFKNIREQYKTIFAGLIEAGVIDLAAREDMLLSVRTMITGQLQLLIPNLIATQSIQGGVACLLLPLRFGYLAEEKRAFLRDEPMGMPGEKQKVDFPTLDMPPFQTWHIPRGIGWQVGVALIGGYLLRYNRTFALKIAGIMLYGAASSVFMIQGAAFINFIQKRRGSRRFWRVIVPLLLMTTPFLTFIGIFDQMNNARGLRKPPEPKEDTFL